MPELPEVQTVVDDLRAAGVEGRTVTDVRISWSNTVRPLPPDQFCREVIGLQIESVWRRGKYIVFRMQPNAAAGGPSAGSPAETAFLLTHLRMKIGRAHV